MNLDYNKMLFKMFMEQNAEKTFSEFGTLGGTDLKYSGMKLKEFKLTSHSDCTIFEKQIDLELLCIFDYIKFKFVGFSTLTIIDINILDHIKFEDKV